MPSLENWDGRLESFTATCTSREQYTIQFMVHVHVHVYIHAGPDEERRAVSCRLALFSGECTQFVWHTAL